MRNLFVEWMPFIPEHLYFSDTLLSTSGSCNGVTLSLLHFFFFANLRKSITQIGKKAKVIP